MRIAIVSDEYWCIEELEGILTKIEVTNVVDKYSNPRVAIEKIREDPPDVVFIAAQMPGMSGLELAKKIKNMLVGVKIVLISEKASYACDSYEIGVDDFLMKPLRSERIHHALSRLFQTNVNEV